MSKPSRFFSVLYNTEASWGDSATATFGTRLQVLEPPELNLTREGMPVNVVQQYSEEGVAHVNGPYGGSLRIVLGLTGHGGATTGALTATDLYDLLRLVVGWGNSTAVGDTIASGTSAVQFADNGALVTTTTEPVRVGVKGDARGNGQFVAINSASTVTLLTAMDGTPNAADQVYVPLTIFPDENPGAIGTITSTRWQVQTANNQWRLWGCFPTGLEFSGLNHGEMPAVAITFGVSYWASTNQTFPDTTAVDAKELSPISMGSTFINDVGTTTRATYNTRSWNLSIDMQTAPVMGPGAANAGQIITGASRNRCAASFDMTFDAEAAGTETWADKWDARTNQHMMMTLGNGAAADDGKMLGFYFRNCRMVGERPTQTEGDGINRVTTQWEALTANTTGVTPIASWRLAMG